MKKLIPVFIVIILIFSACSKLPKGTNTETGFVFDDTGIEYIMCDPGITPIRTGEAYLQVDGNKYLVIEHEDPERFLSDNDPNYKYVFRAKNVPEITMETFEPVAALIYLDGVNEPLDRFTAEKKYLNPDSQNKNTIDESEYTYAIRDAILTQKPIYYNAELIIVDEDYTVYFKMLSQNFPGLGYTVVFVRDINGYNYLKDELTDHFYRCPDNVVYRLWENS